MLEPRLIRAGFGVAAAVDASAEGTWSLSYSPLATEDRHTSAALT
ncbi:hypothetical protein [Arsenicicoccus sp. oral taxon 190]|nr:hypothetical protein [Arsenicicoccus sp. oral taxon 190]